MFSHLLTPEERLFVEDFEYHADKGAYMKFICVDFVGHGQRLR